MSFLVPDGAIGHPAGVAGGCRGVPPARSTRRAVRGVLPGRAGPWLGPRGSDRAGLRAGSGPDGGVHDDYRAAAGRLPQRRRSRPGGGSPGRCQRADPVPRDARQNGLSAHAHGQAAYRDQRWEIARWSSQPPTAFTAGDVTAMVMYAGCGVGDIGEVTSAARIVDRMIADALPLLFHVVP